LHSVRCVLCHVQRRRQAFVYEVCRKVPILAFRDAALLRKLLERLLLDVDGEDVCDVRGTLLGL